MIIEVNDSRREVDAKGFKVYGSDVELKELSDAIRKALSEGLIQGWVGVGTMAGRDDVFPNPDTRVVPTKKWRE